MMISMMIAAIICNHLNDDLVGDCHGGGAFAVAEVKPALVLFSGGQLLLFAIEEIPFIAHCILLGLLVLGMVGEAQKKILNLRGKEGT